MRRNDIIPIDSRSHLEVADRKHRYAKNLRVYFKEYHRLNGITDIVDQPTNTNGSSTPSRKLARYNPFFEWLDNEESLPNVSLLALRSPLKSSNLVYSSKFFHSFDIILAFGMPPVGS